MKEHVIKIVPYELTYAEQTVEMWRNSKERAIGQKEIHDIESHIYFLNYILPEQFQIYLALIEEKVVGLIAYNKEEISQLYVHIDYQGMGIGTVLLNRAKEHAKDNLRLYTFEVNKKAQRFYENNGFKIIGRGHENEEKLPDILYQWCSIINNG